MSVVDRIREQARRRPSHPALLQGRPEGPPEALSYAELVRRADAHAARLRAAGVAAGDRCGLVARQGAGFVEAALGVLAAEACLVPVPDDPAGPALDAFAERAALHHWLREAEGFAPRARREVPSVDGQGDAAFRALRPAYLRFTSGTTSRRKGVILGHEAVEARLAAANRALAIGPEDRVLWLLPMAHHFVVSILLYLSRGATVLLPAGPLARAALRIAERERASVLYASPYHYRLLGKDAGEAKLPALRLAVSTAEGLRAETAHRFAERFGAPVAQALGVIEVGLPVANLERAAETPAALGRPLPDYEVWLRGEDGRPAPDPSAPERSGEICIRGQGMLDAYLEPWTPASEILEPDGFRSGDQGWWDEKGLLHLAGRRANRVNVAGMKFFCEEVEAVLDAHPAVARSRVSSRAHEALGEVPVAEVVSAEEGAPPTRGALAAFCRERLAAYKIPRRFEVVEALPTTPTGKVARGG